METPTGARCEGEYWKVFVTNIDMRGQVGYIEGQKKTRLQNGFGSGVRINNEIITRFGPISIDGNKWGVQLAHAPKQRNVTRKESAKL